MWEHGSRDLRPDDGASSSPLKTEDLAGLADAGTRTRIEAVRRGLPIEGLERVLQAGRLTLDEIDKIVLSRKRILRRRKLGHLTPDESDRFARVVRVIAAAEATFGSIDKAACWLRRPTTVFDGEAPIERLDTHDGIRNVEHLLGRIDHGLAA